MIEKAHELGVYVITADYLPDNAAHKYADEYHNVSVIAVSYTHLDVYKRQAVW